VVREKLKKIKEGEKAKGGVPDLLPEYLQVATGDN